MGAFVHFEIWGANCGVASLSLGQQFQTETLPTAAINSSKLDTIIFFITLERAGQWPVPIVKLILLAYLLD